MEKIGNENLEKISGGKINIHQGVEVTCSKCGKKFRLGDREIFHSECNSCMKKPFSKNLI